MGKVLEEDLFGTEGPQDEDNKAEVKRKRTRKRKSTVFVGGDDVSVMFKISAEVYDKAFRVLQKRGTERFDTYLRLMVMRVRDNPILELTDIMAFGQYKGESIDTIIRIDPRYIEWLLKIKDTFALSEEAMELLDEISAL